MLFAQNRQNVINAEWYEKLNKWQDALDAYERHQLEEPNNINLKLGRMRCLAALGNWQRLHRLAKHAWKNEIIAHEESISSNNNNNSMDDNKSNGLDMDMILIVNKQLLV